MQKRRKPLAELTGAERLARIREIDAKNEAKVAKSKFDQDLREAYRKSAKHMGDPKYAAKY